MQIIVYDIEVFKHDWLVGYTILDLNNIYNSEYRFIHNDHEALEMFYKKHKYDIWVGHNNDSYDNPVLEAILKKDDYMEVSKRIIETREMIFCNLFISYDTMKQPILMQARNFSLKTIALMFGWAGYESPIPWDIDRPLNDKELADLIHYNKIDVMLTLEEFKYHIPNNFTSKAQFCNTFGIHLNKINRTWGSLAALVVEFDSSIKLFENDIYYELPSTLKLSKQYHDTVIAKIPKVGKISKTNKIKYEVAGLEHVLGEGGAHSAIVKSVFEDVYFLDVVSYYPNMHKHYTYMQSRTIKDKYFTGKQIDTRTKLKAEGDPRQRSYKELLVTLYGITKLKSSKFYDPASQYITAISGQLFLLDLNEKLELGMGKDFKLIQGNTDGIVINVPNISDPKLQAIIKEWEERTHFKLETTQYDILYQKDVNNYVAVRYDDDFKKGVLTPGNTALKGKFTNKYFPLSPDKNPTYYDVNNRWMSIGLVRLLVFDKLDISDLDAIELQMIYEKGSAVEMTLNGFPVGKAIRAYPVLPRVEGQGQISRIYNIRGKKTIKKDGPSNMKIYMDQILNVPESFYETIDYDYYYDEIIDKAIDFGYRGYHAYIYILSQLKSASTDMQKLKLANRLDITVKELVEWAKRNIL